VDSLDSFVVSTNNYDGKTAVRYWNKMYNENELLENIKLIFADVPFCGTFREEMGNSYNIIVEIFKISTAGKGKVEIHEKRWIVESSIFWTLNNRRCSKDCEGKAENSTTFIIVANIKRLATEFNENRFLISCMLQCKLGYIYSEYFIYI
jgi:hypothetical protein